MEAGDDVIVWGQLPALRWKPMRKLGTRACARMRSRFRVPLAAWVVEAAAQSAQLLVPSASRSNAGARGASPRRSGSALWRQQECRPFHILSCHHVAAAKAMVVALRVQVPVATRPVCGDGECILKRQLRRAACGSRAGKRCEDRVDRIGPVGQ